MSVQNMLEPMKLHKTPKGQCQNEPWDLSISHQEADTDISGDLTKDGDNVVNLKENVLIAENDVSGNDRPSTPVPEPGMHTEIDETDEPLEVPPDKLKSALDNLCHTWSEVKLHRLTNSELECYLGKVNENTAPTLVLKGDNIVSENLTADQTPPLQHCLDQGDLSDVLQQSWHLMNQIVKTVTVRMMLPKKVTKATPQSQVLQVHQPHI